MIYCKQLTTCRDVTLHTLRDETVPTYVTNSIMLIYAHKASVSLKVNDRTTELSEGDMALVLPRNTLSHAFISGVDYMTISIPEVYGSMLIAEYERLTPCTPVITGIDNVAVVRYIESNKESKYAIMTAINHIAQYYTTMTRFVPSNEKLRAFMTRTIEYVDANYTYEPTIDSLAESLGYATHYVSGLIGKMFSSSFSVLLNERRIAHATYLMHDRSLTISDIGTMSGYASTRSFNRNFAIINGMTPSEYREQLIH